MKFLFKSERGEELCDWVDWLWSSKSGEVVFTQTGGMLRVAQIEPPDLETASDHELVTFHKQHTRILTLPGTGWSSWMDQWRRADDEYVPRADFGGNRAAQIVDGSRRRQFVGARDVFSNRTYVALHMAPQPRDAVLAFLNDRDSAERGEVLRTFLDHTDEYFRALAHVCPSVRVLAHEALATYLAEATTYRRIPTALPAVFDAPATAPQLCCADWDNSVGTELFVDGLCVKSVEVHVFGSATPLTFEMLHELPFPARWTVTSHFMDPGDQKAAIGRLRNFWRPKQYGWGGWVAIMVSKNRSHSTSKPDVDRVLGELDELEAALPVEQDGLATTTMTVRVWHENPTVAEDRAQTVVSHLNSVGFRSRTATYNSTLGPIADIPGNASRDLLNRRRPQITLSTISRCAPVTGLTTGHRQDDHLAAPALLVAHSRRRGPLFWSLHSPGNDVGHTAVIGPTGGGKSVLLSTIAMQYQRYPGSTVTMFDKRRSAMVATLCSDDAQWLELGSGGVGVQPLRSIDDADGFTWATGWVQEALKLRHVPMTAEVDAAVNEAMSALRSLPPDSRTISALCAHMGGSERARSAMRYYTSAGSGDAHQGALGDLVDGVVPSYGNARMLCIEYDLIMQPNFPEGALIFAACFHQIERERLTSGGHPKLVMVDEAWEPLGHPLFRKWLTDMSLTGRKLNMQLLLATQSVRHLDQDHTAVIMEQTQNKIFTANPTAVQSENRRRYEGIGLTEQQVDTIASLRAKGEYLLQTPSFCRVADITLEGPALRICGASRPEHIARARALLAEGVKPGREFLRRWTAARTGVAALVEEQAA